MGIMISIISLETGSSGGVPEIEVIRPVTPRQVAERLSRKPFEVIADLMALNHFASMQEELSDGILVPLGARYGIRFRVIDQA